MEMGQEIKSFTKPETPIPINTPIIPPVKLIISV